MLLLALEKVGATIFVKIKKKMNVQTKKRLIGQLWMGNLFAQMNYFFFCENKLLIHSCLIFALRLI